MSLYNMIHGVNPLAAVILGLIDDAPKWPRFRDCYMENLHEPGLCVAVYTRAGGGNRESYEAEIEAIRDHPQFVADVDDDFDCTYATFWFAVPEDRMELARELLDPDAEAPGKRMVALIQKMQDTPHDRWNTDPELVRVRTVMAPLMDRIAEALKEQEKEA